MFDSNVHTASAQDRQLSYDDFLRVVDYDHAKRQRDLYREIDENARRFAGQPALRVTAISGC
jgi:hypothetical protein